MITEVLPAGKNDSNKRSTKKIYKTFFNKS